MHAGLRALPTFLSSLPLPALSLFLLRSPATSPLQPPSPSIHRSPPGSDPIWVCRGCVMCFKATLKAAQNDPCDHIKSLYLPISPRRPSSPLPFSIYLPPCLRLLAQKRFPSFCSSSFLLFFPGNLCEESPATGLTKSITVKNSQRRLNQ